MPIHVKIVNEKGKMTLFKGSIKPGLHTFSFVFVLKSDKAQIKADGQVAVEVRNGENFVSLKTSRNQDGRVITEIVDE